MVVVLAAVLAVLAGCASVPGDSDVSVLRRVGDPAEPTAPAGPARGAGPLEIARGWVLASGAAAGRHEAARGFLTTSAAGAWDDGAAPTVVSDRVDTVFAERAGTAEASVRIRGTTLGTLTPAGVFVPRPGPFELVVGLVQQNGQWRMSELPPGTVVRRSDLAANTRPMRAWFVGAVSGLPVAETRYLLAGPARSVPARALDLLAGGPSPELAGAVGTALPPRATVRAADSPSASGALVVDLEGADAVDGVRREQIARQVVLTLAGLGVPRVRLLLAGTPLVPERPELAVGDVLAGLPAAVLRDRDLPLDPGSASGDATVPTSAVVTNDGRVTPVGEPSSAPAPAPDPSAAVLAEAPGPDGRRARVLAGPRGAGPGAPAGARSLVVDAPGEDPTATGVTGASFTLPSWNPGGTEVWTVVDGTRVVRVVGGSGTWRPAPVDAGALLAAGPLSALRLSPDGVRVLAVAGGRVVVGVVVRDGAGGVRLQGVRVLRPLSGTEGLEGVLDAAWTASDRIVAVGARTGHIVAFASVDGLDLDDAPTINLTPPVTAVAAAPAQPVIVVDQSGLWTFPDDTSGVWRSLAGGTPGSVPAYGS